MNRIYKVIWSKTKHCYVVVSELAKRHTKGGSAGGCRMMTTRVLSTLLLGAYLVGGYSLPSAWADGESQDVGARTAGITRTSTDATNPVIYTTKIENSLTVTSDGKVQWGNATQALGDYSTAFGSGTRASGANSTAFGSGTTAKGVSSTAFGSGTTASGVYSTAFGEGTLADGSHSTAWGDYTQALSYKSTAFGDHTTAGHDNATAWGYETTAGDRTTTAFGDNTAALMEGATAWGHNTKAGKWTVKDDQGIVHDVIIEKYIDDNPDLGPREMWGVKYAENKGTDDVFIGGQTSYTSAYTALKGRASTDPYVTMQGNYATAWGNGTEAEGDYSTAFGNYTKTAAVTSFKYNGTEAKVETEEVVVRDASGNIVYQKDPVTEEETEEPLTETKYKIANAVNPNTNLIGDNTYFDTEDAAMKELLLNGTIAGGYGATAFGLLTEAKGAHSTAFGVRTTAEGIGATAWGNGTQATGDYSTAWGKDAQATGNYATAIGAAIDDNSTVTASEAQADYSVAMLGGKTYKSPDDPNNNTPINAKNSLAIGVGSLTYAENSIAVLGGMTDEKATNSIAIGRGQDTPSLANAENSLAVLGGAAGNHGTNSIALGGALGKDTDNNDIFVSSTTYGPNSVAMLGGTTGYPDSGNELLQAKNALAIGLDSVAGGSNSIAIGHGGKDSADHIVGSNAYAENSLAVFGGTTISGATNSIALGGAVDASGVFVSSTTNGSYSVAMLGGTVGEERLNTQPKNALAIGLDSVAIGSNSIAIGRSGKDGDRDIVGSTANAENSLAVFGGVTEDYATNSIALGGAVDASGNFMASTTYGANSVAMLGGTTTEEAENSLAVGIGATTDKEHTVALGYGRFNDSGTLFDKSGPVASGEGSIAIGADAVANGANTIALGGAQNDNDEDVRKSIANGANTLAVLGGKTGYNADDADTPLATTSAIALGGAIDGNDFVSSTANANYSLALLGGVTGDVSDPTVGQNSLAVGVGSVTKAANSVAMLGGTTTEEAENSLAIGRGAQATLSDSIALGSGAVADRAKYDGTDNKYTAYLGDETGETKTGSAWRATANAIAIGHIDTDDTKSVTRQIIGVAAGTEDTDAVNVAQLKAATFDMQGITRTETGTPGEAGYVATTTIEKNLSVSSDGKVKWGNGTKAEGDYSTAGGFYTKANGQYATAFGRSTEANGYNSTAFGNAAKANGQDATAFGNAAKANGQYSTAFGSSSIAAGDYSTAFGRSTEAKGYNSTAFGNSTQANGQDATAFGYRSIAVGDNSTAFGSYTQAGKLTYKKGDGSETEAKIVEYTTAAGDRKYKIVSKDGNDDLSDNGGAGFYYSDALNDSNLTKQGDSSTAFGSRTIALGDYSTAFGYDTEASGTGATAWGSSTKALGTYSTAFGNGSVANAYNSLAALGGTTGEKATNSVAIGTDATVGGAYDSGNTETEGTNAFAFGNGAQATLSDSVALGSGAVANRAKYNTNNAYKAYLNEDDNNQKIDPAWRATHNAIAVGSDDTSNPVTRQIIGVAAGSADTDAVNVAQLKAATFDMQGITRTRSENDNDGYTYTTTIEDKLSVSSNGAFSISGNKFTVDSDGAISAANGNFTVAADGSLSAGTATVSGLMIKGETSTSPIDRTAALATDGLIESGNEGYVTGGKVYAVTNALSDRLGTIATDGHYIEASTTKNIAENLVALDTQVFANTEAIAVNKSAITTTGITFTADNTVDTDETTNSGAIKLGDPLKLEGGSNIITEASAGKVNIKLNNSIDLGSTGSMTIGSATLNTDGLAIGTTASLSATGLTVGNTSVTNTGLAITEGPSVTTSGIDAGGKQITNLLQAVNNSDAVNYEQLKNYVDTKVITGGSFAAGKGMTLTDDGENHSFLDVNAGAGLNFTDDNSKLKVNAGDGLTFDTENGNALKVNAGEGLTFDTEENEYKLKVNKGAIADNDAGFVTGGTVYSALSAYAKSDRATLTNATISTGSSITDEVMLGTGTTAVSVGTVGALNDTINNTSTGLVAKVGALENTVGDENGGLVKDVKDNKTSISALATTVGDAESGLVKDVKDNKDSIDALATTLGSTDSGLVQKVNNNASSITTLQGKTQNITATDGATTITGTLNAGVTTVTSLNVGTGAISGGTLNVGGMATVTGLTVGGTNVTTALKTTGAVAENNEGFVTGGTVFSAMQAYQPNGVIEAGNTKAVSGDTVYKVTSKLDERITANADAIATKADASTVTDLSGKVSANEAAIKTNTANIAANKEAIASNKSAIETNTKNITANTKAIASNKSAIETNTKNITANKEAIASNKTAIEKNAGDIKTLGTKVDTNAKAIDDNAKAIKTNADNITSLSSKVTSNETALSKKADKANTLKGYGIEDAYTKEDTDTLLNKKADKTELEKVKATADSNKKALDALGDVQELTKDAETVKKIANDVESVVKEQDGVVAAEGKPDSDELVKGSTVYDYLNKGKDGDGTLVLGTESKNISMGQGSKATGVESIAIGNETDGQNNEASGKQSIAIGFGNKVSGAHSGAIGDPNIVNGSDSYVVGNSNNVAAGLTDVFVLGNNVNVTGGNTVVLGSGSDGSESNVVSVGATGTERRITHVADGTDAHDAATFGQLQAVNQAAYNNAVNLSNSINRLDSRINKVGAGAAALAALHPMDTDGKFAMGLGYGNYRSANAMAMGLFYRPTDNVMFSIGGSMGNGENMVNAGITIALDKGFTTSKAVMAKNIKALSAENAAIREENADMRKQLDEQGAKLTTQEAEIQALKAALARLEAKMAN